MQDVITILPKVCTNNMKYCCTYLPLQLLFMGFAGWWSDSNTKTDTESIGTSLYLSRHFIFTCASKTLKTRPDWQGNQTALQIRGEITRPYALTTKFFTLHLKYRAIVFLSSKKPFLSVFNRVISTLNFNSIANKSHSFSIETSN